MRTEEQRLRYLAKAKAKAAARAISEGRVPGKQGRPKKMRTEEEKKTLHNARVKKYREEHLEASREYKREYERKRAADKAIAEGRLPGRSGPPRKYASNEEYLAARAITRKRYYQEHRDKLAAAAKEREQKKRDAIKAMVYVPTRQRVSLEDKRAKVNSAASMRRAQKLSMGHEDMTPADLRTMRWRQNGICLYCNMNLGEHDIHVDHWIPLAKGGSGNKNNLCLLHGTCNLKKGAKHPDEFAPIYAIAA